MSRSKKLIVIGGGASGFFCAVNAARQAKNLEVVIVEKTAKLLSKVKVSGGGRCNVTHASQLPEDMIDAYPRGRHFLRKTLHQFHTRDTIAWFAERGVQLKTEADGRMFPVTNTSQTIVDCLLKEAERFGVEILMNTEVSNVQPSSTGFTISLVHPQKGVNSMQADYLCIATGGHPKMAGFEWLLQLRLAVAPPVPSLFTFNIPDKQLHALMGLSVQDAVVKIPGLKVQERGSVLVTHWGLSGPAVLKLSSKAARELHGMDYVFDVLVNWVPEHHESAMLETLKEVKHRSSAQHIGTRNPFALPGRMWAYLIQKAGIHPDTPWSDIPQSSLARLSRQLCADSYRVGGKTTFKEEFVTAGGIQLSEVDPLTMESKKLPGIYFAGEVMDVDGITGGYNFQHAWSSGWIAARAISKKSLES